VSDQQDLDAFRDAWILQRDLLTGRRYIEALEAAGDQDTALAICAEMWDRGFESGLVDAAWILKDRGDILPAIETMSAALEVLDPEHIPLTQGVIGHWRWHFNNDQDAEPQLRAGMSAYGTAWADLGYLLMATGRESEARQVWEDGTREGVVECMLPLANLLADTGDRLRADAVYRQAIDLGDGHSAWNLATHLLGDGHEDEAALWQWKAAEMGDEVAIRYLAEVNPLD
jgi:tetratricopeptide (TPR) repeat protein